jgi:predicted phosphodiesterase
MKTLIFSDTHLGKKVDQKKLNFLKKIILEADRVIINGDFWDRFSCTFDEFVNSGWSELFPLLKKRQTIYIYGNHDGKKFSDKRVDLFSNEQREQLNLVSGKKKFFIEHGNSVLYTSKLWDIKIFEFAVCKSIEILDAFFLGILKVAWYKPYNILKNRELIEWKKENIESGTFYITGHTHLPEIDEKVEFANTGRIKHGFGDYLVLEDGKVSLKQLRY